MAQGEEILLNSAFQLDMYVHEIPYPERQQFAALSAFREGRVVSEAVKEAVIDKAALKEQCDFSQRVESFEIYAITDRGEIKIFSGTVIGFRKLALFEPVKARGVKIRITSCRGVPYIQNITLYEANGGVPSFTKARLLAERIGKFIRVTGGKIYMASERRKNKKAAKGKKK